MGRRGTQCTNEDEVRVGTQADVLIQGPLFSGRDSVPRSGRVLPQTSLLLALLLPCSRNILILRSETGRTIEWAQAHFFVAAGGNELVTGLGRGVFA